MLTAIVGVNWGDEGKGRMVDLLSERCDVVVRYQGGNNAGHTVVNDRGRFILNLMPSGILREGTVNVLGPGMVIDLEHLCGEAARLREGGISVTPENLKISDRATICMPYHKLLDDGAQIIVGSVTSGSGIAVSADRSIVSESISFIGHAAISGSISSTGFTISFSLYSGINHFIVFIPFRTLNRLLA